MKNLILMTVIVGSLISCSFDRTIDLESLEEISEPTQYIHNKWALIAMSGNLANVPPTTGSEMAWQEYYLLNADSTFTKSRNQNDLITEASGTYAFVVLSDGDYLELNYQIDNNLIGNCTAEAKEYLFLHSEHTLVGTWSACDGPGLVYEKVK